MVRESEQLFVQTSTGVTAAVITAAQALLQTNHLANVGSLVTVKLDEIHEF